MTHETEKGFGCGLRAEIDRKQTPPGGIEVLEPAPEAAPAPPPQAAIASEQSTRDLAALQAELEASLTREQQLRETLEHHLEAYERELTANRELAVREAETSQRAAKLDAAHAEIEERDSVLLVHTEALEHERATIAATRAELAAEEARLTELARHVDARAHELESADEERAQASAEVAKHLAGIAERERELKRESAAMDARRQEAEARVTLREQTVRRQDEEARTRERAADDRYRAAESAMKDVMRERERLQERAEAVAARETSLEERLVASEAALDERVAAHERTVAEAEAALATWQNRLRTDDERLARERAGYGQASQEAFALLAELERREATVKQDEEELRQEQQRLSHVAEDARQLQAREEALAVREAAGDQRLSELAERFRRLEAREQALEAREADGGRVAAHAQVERELAPVAGVVSLREARLEADFELREDKLVDLARDLAEREELLAARESDLADYVTELQGRFHRAEQLAEVHELHVA